MTMRSNPVLICLLFLAADLLAQPVIPPPSQSDEIIIDAGIPGSADPNDRIRYTVIIQNTGTDSATMVQLNAMIDPNTTLVPGSFRTSPMAANDSYMATGNVGISIPAPGVKTNDFDDQLAAATLSCGACMSTNGGTVVINNDGSFTYTPPPGFTGTDDFTYTMTDSNPVGGPVPVSDMATVTIAVTNLIWFIDNSSVAATSDGRLTSPFKSITDFNAGSAAAGDVVYIEHTGTNYLQGIQLAIGERLYGEGHTGGTNLSDVLPFALAPNSFALPAINGTRPQIQNAAGNGITLAMNNEIRGLEVGATSGAKIFGGPFGTLTVGNTTSPDVLLSGNGQALNLSGGTFAATSQFISVTSTSSTSSGILLNNVQGTLDMGSTTISGSTTQGILMSASTASVDFGNTAVTPGTDGISLQNNSSGTRTFGTISVTNGTGVGFLHSNGGGLTTVTGTTTITNPGGRGIDIEDAVASNGVTFVNVSVTQSGGTGVFLEDNAGTVTFSDLDISPDAGQRAFHANNNTGTISISSGTITNSGATGVEITRAAGLTPVNIIFNSITSSGGANGVLLNNVSGTFDGGTGTISMTTGTGFLITNGTATITYSGTLNTSATFAVDIDNHDSNNITFQTGNISNSGSGIRVQNSNGGTILFSNPGILLTTATNKGVTLASNSGAAINFTGGNLSISTSTAIGFDATGGGTITVTGSGNDITSTSNTALNVVNTTIGANDLNFELINAGNNTAAADPANGIVINNTGLIGGLTVTGSGSTNGSGGTIQNITNRGIAIFTAADINLNNIALTNANLTDAGTCGASDNSGCNAAIHLNNVTNVILTNVDISGTTTQQGINAREVNGFQLLNSSIINAGTGGQPEEGSLYAINLFGTVEIDNTTMTFPGGRCVTIYNTSRTIDMDVTNSSFTDTQTSAVGADAFEYSAFGTSVTTMDIDNNDFLRSKTNGIQIIHEDNSTGSVDITNNTIDYDGAPGGGAGIDFDAADNANVDFNINNNPLIRGALTTIVNVFAAGNAIMEGRVNNNIVQSGAGSGTGIRVLGQEDADIIIEINGNTVSGITLDNGINVESRLGTGRVDANVVGNTVSVAAGANANIRSAAGNSGSVHSNKTCAWVHNNILPAAGFSHHEGRVVNAHELILQGGGASMAANWNNNTNTPLSPPAVMNPLISGAGTITFTGTCTLPTNPLP